MAAFLTSTLGPGLSPNITGDEGIRNTSKNIPGQSLEIEFHPITTPLKNRAWCQPEGSE
jgi:hypothetical protein